MCECVVRERKWKRKWKREKNVGEELLMESLGRRDPLKLAKYRLRISSLRERNSKWKKKKNKSTSLVSIKSREPNATAPADYGQSKRSMAWLMLIFSLLMRPNPRTKSLLGSILISSSLLLDFSFCLSSFSKGGQNTKWVAINYGCPWQ